MAGAAGAGLAYCPYSILGVPRNASADEIRAAFRRAALRTHPDKLGGSKEAFNAVQYAYNALLGDAATQSVQANGTWTSGLWATESVFDPWSTASAAAAPTATNPCSDTWGAASGFDSWNDAAGMGAAAFDPWSASAPSSISTFDPWSTTTGNLASAGGGADCVFCAQGQCWSHNGYVQSTGGADAASTVLVLGANTSSVLASDAKKRKVKKRPKNDSLALMSHTKRRLGIPSGKGYRGKGLPVDDPSKQLTRYGVYGFRPDSSSEEESEDNAVPGTVPVQAPGAGLASSFGSLQAATAIRPQRQQRQFYCSLHNKIRCEADLVDDGEGNPVCRMGKECP